MPEKPWIRQYIEKMLKEERCDKSKNGLHCYHYFYMKHDPIRKEAHRCCWCSKIKEVSFTTFKPHGPYQ